MIERYERCWGLSFPAIGRWKIELWFCPAGYEIKEHKHGHQDIWLFFLFGGGTTFWRKRITQYSAITASKTVSWRDFGSRFTILRGDSHSFTVSKLPLIFLNVEKWYCKPTSAAKDFQLT